MATTITATSRHLAGAPATISSTINNSNGDPDLTVTAATVTIVRGDGTTLVAATSATQGSDGAWTYALTGPQTAQLDYLTATWTVAGITRAVTVHEIVGGFYFTLTDARAADPSLASATYSDGQLLAARREVEDEFERLTGVSFVPRYRRIRVGPNQINSIYARQLKLPNGMVRRIRSVRVMFPDQTYTTFTDRQLAALVVNDSGIVSRTDSSIFYPGPAYSYVFEYEHGYDICPSDVRRAAITRLRMRANMGKNAIPDRATSFSIDQGGTYRLDTPDERKLGVPEIDAVLDRYRPKAQWYGIA